MRFKLNGNNNITPSEIISNIICVVIPIKNPNKNLFRKSKYCSARSYFDQFDTINVLSDYFSVVVYITLPMDQIKGVWVIPLWFKTLHTYVILSLNGVGNFEIILISILAK